MRPKRLVPIFCAGVLFLFAGVVGLRQTRDAKPPSGKIASPVEMSEWSLADLRDHLGAHGLALTLSGEYAEQPAAEMGYLRLPAVPAPAYPLLVARAHLGRWRGIVYVARVRDSSRDMLLTQEPGCSARVGPWLMFGDPAVLGKIVDILREAR